MCMFIGYLQSKAFARRTIYWNRSPDGKYIPEGKKRRKITRSIHRSLYYLQKILKRNITTKNENGKILKRKIIIARLKVYKKRKHDERDDTDKTIENEKKPGNVEQSENLKACKKRKHDEIDDIDNTDEEENEKKPENVGLSGNLKIYKKRKHDELDDTDKTDNEEENEKKPENVGHYGNLKVCTKRKHDESDVDYKICDGKNNSNRRNNNMGQTDIKTRGRCKYCLHYMIFVGIGKVFTRKCEKISSLVSGWIDHMRLLNNFCKMSIHTWMGFNPPCYHIKERLSGFITYIIITG